MANLPESPIWENGIYQYEITDPLQSGPDGIDNIQGKQLANRTAYLKKAVEDEATARDEKDEELQEAIDQNSEDIGTNARAISAMKGRGGYLTAHDFGSATPSQEELTAYALSEIGSEEPTDIWNGTHVKNIWVDPDTIDDDHPNGIQNNHVWALTNTPDTEPAIFEWTDDGFDSVSVAGENIVGLVSGSSADEESGVAVNPTTGKMSIILPSGLVGSNSLDFIARSSPFAAASGKRQITIKKRTFIPLEVSGVERWCKFEADTVLDVESLLDTGDALQAGKDYKVFLVPDGTGFAIKVSLEDVPDGYTPDQVRCFHGFHTLCVAAGAGMTYTFGGDSLDHPLNGYGAGDILPQSVWCLNHRPYSSPAGMVYIPNLDFWCDIYLQSGTGITTKSAYQGAITRNRQYVDFVEDQFCVNKALLNDEEFASAMLGSNEKTAVFGSSESGATTGGAGGRKDTANRRMLSVYGVEEGCGSLWQWLATTSAAGSTGWTTQNGGKGDFYGSCFVLLAGGGWNAAAYCGSRARDAANSRADAAAGIGGRGRSRAMR